MPQPSSMAFCIASRMSAMRSRPSALRNRLSSRLRSSLTSCATGFDLTAGRSTACRAADRPARSVKSNPVAQLVSDERKRLDSRFLRADGRERIADIREAMQKAMEDGCGIYRERSTMEATCKILRELRGRFARIGLSDRGAVFNTELVAALA